MTTTYDSLPVLHPEKDAWYTVHKIPKRSGGVRIIEAPVDWLKEVQRKIYEEVLLPTCPVSVHAYGCIKNRNIKQAADIHVGQKQVLKVDLKDFFHTITTDMIRKSLLCANIDPSMTEKIVYLCTNSRGVLPQGSPASPSLANIVATKFYATMGKIAKSCGVKFSAYMDDLVFSGDKVTGLKPIIKKIAGFYKFKFSEEKTVLMRRKKEVLGLCVAAGKDHARLPKKLRNNIRAYLHCVERDVEKGTLDMTFFHHVAGLVSFAAMAGDQKAANFVNSIKLIANKLKVKNERATSADSEQKT